jgi:hypothetical protein
MMDDVSKRSAVITAGLVILSAVCLMILAAFLASQGLDRAAAWSNILALPVGILGVAVGALALRPSRDRHTAPPTGGLPDQVGVGYSQVNMVGGTVNIDNRKTDR